MPTQFEYEAASRGARLSLRAMPKLRDNVLKLLMEEAQLVLTKRPDGTVYLQKQSNVRANIGVSPEIALAQVIAAHLT